MVSWSVEYRGEGAAPARTQRLKRSAAFMVWRGARDEVEREEDAQDEREEEMALPGHCDAPE